MGTLTADLNAVASSGSAGDFPKTATACQKLGLDVRSAQAAMLPTPDGQLTSFLSAALAHYEASADYCVAGVRALDARKMTLAATEITAGTTQIELATDRLGELNGTG
jgi:hypothetical protein